MHLGMLEDLEVAAVMGPVFLWIVLVKAFFMVPQGIKGGEDWSTARNS